MVHGHHHNSYINLTMNLDIYVPLSLSLKDIVGESSVFEMSH